MIRIRSVDKCLAIWLQLWMLSSLFWLHSLAKIRYTIHHAIFLKWAFPGLFLIYFRLLQTKIRNFTTIKYEKMSIQYTVLGFEPTTFGTRVSSHNH